MKEYFKTAKKSIHRIRKFIGQTYLIIILFILYVTLHLPINKIISALFVTPIFSEIEISILNDIIVSIILIFTIFDYWQNFKKRVFISDKRIILSFFTFSIIVFHRINHYYFTFTPTYLLPSVKYIDIIILYLFLQIATRFYTRKTIRINSDEGFFFDNPIHKVEEDLYNRKKSVDTIVEKIKNTLNPETSFAIGLSSEWGNGKTSFLNLLESSLKNENRIIIHFNPWLNNDQNKVIDSFFDELSNSLRPFNKDLSSNLLVYSDFLQNSGSDSLKTTANIINHVFNKTSLRERFEYINDSIKALKSQIIIIIDDIDRLYESEILEVLRLIRNSASFANTVFIVGYDRNYLISAIRKVSDYKPETYLDKIFQFEFALPAFEIQTIKDKLKERISPVLIKEDLEDFENILNKTRLSFEGNGFKYEMIENLRNLNRFINSFIISYDSLKGECKLNDLLCVELLKMKYLSIYNLLVKNHNRFIREHQHNFHEDATLRLFGRTITDNGKEEENKITTLEEYLNEHHPQLGLNKNQIGDVMLYITNLFPIGSKYFFPKLEPLSIRNPICVERYFHNGLLSSNLSNIEFATFRAKSEQEFLKQIDKWIKSGLQNELVSRFHKTITFTNRADYEKMMKGLVLLGSYILPNSENTFIGIDHTMFLACVNQNKGELFYETQEEYAEFIKSLFINIQPPFISISYLIDALLKDTIHLDGWNFILPLEFFVEKKHEYFKKYCESIEKIDIFFFWLYNFCNYQEWYSIGDKGYKQKEIKSKKSAEIVKELAKRLPANFLKNIITNNGFPNDEIKKYGISGIVLFSWDNWNSFEEYLNKIKDENEIVEFLSFYEKLKANEYNPIEYKFSPLYLSESLLLRD